VLQVLDLLGRAANQGLEQALASYAGSKFIVTAGQDRTFIELNLSGGENYPSALRYGFELCDEGTAHREWLFASKGERRERWNQLLSREDESLWIINEQVNQRVDLPLGTAGAWHLNRVRLSFEIIKLPIAFPALAAVQSDLGRIQMYGEFLSTPAWMRDVREGNLSPFDSAVVAPEPRIDRRGLGLINALFDMQNNHHDVWVELLDAFRAEFPFVLRIEFPADTAGGRIGLGWRDSRFPGVRMQGHQMSEGMTSYLCLLAAVLSPEPATAIAFDEPDVHLHPSAMRRLVHLLEKASERTAVFVATHSDRFLDYLSDPSGSLRVCEPKDGGVTVHSLNRDALDAWRKDYSLSELRQRGHLDSSNESAAEI
jgi:predicted ATPase